MRTREHLPVEHSATPFEKLDKSLSRTIGIGVYRAILILMVFAQLWLTANYVRRSEFEKLKDDISEIRQTIRDIARQDTEIKDHEMRIRALEQRQYNAPH